MIGKIDVKQYFCTDRKISAFAVYLLCVLIWILLTPILARNVPNVIIIGLMLLFVVSVMPRFRGLCLSDKITLFILAACMAVETAYKLIGKSSAALYYYFNTVQFFFFLGAAIMIRSSLNRRQRIFILAVAVGSMILVMLHNILLFFIHGSDAYVELFKEAKYTTNSVNTPYISAIMLLSGVALIAGMYKKDRKIRLAAFVVAAFCFAFVVFIAQRMIVLVLTVLMYGMILLAVAITRWGKKLSKKQTIILLVCIGVAVVALVLLAVPILRLVRNVVSSDRLVKRINQLIRLLKTGDFSEAGGSLAARYELMATSWKTFTASFGNFMIGAGDHRETNEIIGNHSFILDELARYGILFAPITFYLLYRGMMTIRKMAGVRTGTVISRQLSALMITLVLRAMVGAIFDPSIGICLFIVIPMLIKTIRLRKHRSVIENPIQIKEEKEL